MDKRELLFAWGVMDVVEVLWDDGKTRGQNTRVGAISEAG